MEHIALRQWRDEDLDAFAAMNGDTDVMRFFPATMSPHQSAVWMGQQRKLLSERGWGLWAVDVDGSFAGMTGLAVPTIPLPFAPCVEIAWRLRREYWGRGIAFQAAQAALNHGFRVLHLPEVVAFTATLNVSSVRLMQRLGFVHDPREDFDHPAISEGDRLRPHVLYRLKRDRHETWTLDDGPLT